MKQTITKAIVASMIAVVGITNFSFAAPAQPVNNFIGNQNDSGISVPWQELDASDNLITTIKSFVNLALGFLGLIALIVLLYGWFQMVTAAGDEGKYKNGFKILRQAGIGLIFIGLSALFVQLIFWILWSIT